MFGLRLVTRCKPLFLGRRDRARIAVNHLDPAGRAAGVAAAAMQDVDPGVLDRKHEPSPVVGN